jgi:hypothetical protein
LEARTFTMAEIGGRLHVVTSVTPPQGTADWLVVIARRDGTEPVVVMGVGGRPLCSCDQGRQGWPCGHLAVLARLGFAGPAPAPRTHAAAPPVARVASRGSQPARGPAPRAPRVEVIPEAVLVQPRTWWERAAAFLAPEAELVPEAKRLGRK